MIMVGYDNGDVHHDDVHDVYEMHDNNDNNDVHHHDNDGDDENENALIETIQKNKQALF